MELESFLIRAYEDKVERKKLIVAGEFDSEAVEACAEASARGWVEPLFCGSAFDGRIQGMEHIFPSLDASQSRDKAGEMASSGEADAVMYTGPLDEGLLRPPARTGGKYTPGRVLSYVHVFLAPRDHHLTLLTDTLFNASPSLKEKIAIIENAVAAAASLGIREPLIAALAPLELVNPDIPSTLDAAILSKMSQRGQFGRAVIEGPLGMDNAESASAARVKGINSPVPGHVDIYFFPDLESASITAQFISRPGGCRLGGIVRGSDFPVIVRSPLETRGSWPVNILLGIL